MPPTLALIGDYSPEIIAHRAIPRALELAQAASGSPRAWRWVTTRNLQQPAFFHRHLVPARAGCTEW